MTRLLVATGLALTLLACPKNGPVTTVAGTDDEKMDALSAQLEELKTRTDVKCPDWCTLKAKACDLSKQVCEIATRASERAEFQQKCVSGNEECARFTDGCATCTSP